MRLLRPVASLAALVLMACAPSEPALAQGDTVRVHVEVPTQVTTDTVALHATRDSLVQARGRIAQDSSDNTQLGTTLKTVITQNNALLQRRQGDSVMISNLSIMVQQNVDSIVLYRHQRDSLLALPPPVPPPPVVKIVAINVSYDSLAVDSMKIWRIDTNPPVSLDAMPLTVGQSVPISIECFNHAKRQIRCPADLKVTSSDPSIVSVSMSPHAPLNGAAPPTTTTTTTKP